MAYSAAEQFFHHYVKELAAEGLGPSQIRQFAWNPTPLDELAITGEGRDRDLRKLALSVEQVQAVLADQTLGGTYARNQYANEKIVLVVVPGFTHETLKNLSFHQEMNRPDSRHHIMMLRPTPTGIPTAETGYAQGNGLRVVYAKYPRSNAASEHINQPLFDLLHQSRTLKRWVKDEGYKLVFLGYSYGCPLSLELLSDLSCKRFEDDFILDNTAAFIGLCGAIGGSYLASDVLRDDSKIMSIPKLVERSRKYPLIGKIAGLPTAQFQDDMVGGIQSLTREVRKARMEAYGQHLPSHVKYFSLGAVMPLDDYERSWKQLNFDDYAMYMQAKVSDPISVYNDGQVVLEDMLVPKAPNLPDDHHHHLGAVRAHHWAVSYQTFNFGKNKFPRRALYRSVLSICKALGGW